MSFHSDRIVDAITTFIHAELAVRSGASFDVVKAARDSATMAIDDALKGAALEGAAQAGAAAALRS